MIHRAKGKGTQTKCPKKEQTTEVARALLAHLDQPPPAPFEVEAGFVKDAVGGAIRVNAREDHR